METQKDFSKHQQEQPCVSAKICFWNLQPVDGDCHYYLFDRSIISSPEPLGASLTSFPPVQTLWHRQGCGPSQRNKLTREAFGQFL